MVRFGDPGPIARINRLTPVSIQDALRTYFQPIKNDNPQLDFYTIYKRETVEYDTEHMQKYDEDLNTTLIFVRFCITVCYHYAVLTAFSGRSVLLGQLRLRHRRPVETRTRLYRTVGSIPPSNPPQPQPIRQPWRRPCSASSVERSPFGGYYRLEPPVCESSDVIASCIRCNAGQAVAE